MDIWQTRRENMRQIIANTDGGVKTISSKLGYSNSSYLVQMAGPNPTRPISERNARTFELKLGLEAGTLDKALPAGYVPQETRKAPIASEPLARYNQPQPLSDVDIGALVLAVGKVLQIEKVDLPTAKFAALLSIAVNDAKEHGGQPREDVIKSLVDLAR